MVKDASPLVSVVVPVYNVEEYIDACLESLVEQTYQNIEIILVDDATPDGSSKKCDTWAKKDKRITVIHNRQNKGLFQARIIGFEKMKGSYFIVVDSDDYIESNFVEKFLKVAQRDDADIVVSNRFMSVSSSGLVGDMITLPKMYASSEVFDVFMKHLAQETWGWSVWSKMYKKPVYEKSREHLLLINKKINTAEDVLFSTIFASVASRVSYVPTYAGYYYRQNNESITRKISNEAHIAKLDSTVTVLIELKEFMQRANLLHAYATSFDKFMEHVLSNYVWGLHNEHLGVMSHLTSDINEQKAANVELLIKNTELEQQNNLILNSRTYRAARLLAVPYGKLRKMIK